MQYAVVDIETTGNNVNVDEIIQIGVVIMDEHHIIETYETYIHTTETIPSFIESLTGINNEMLTDAPTFDSIAQHLFHLLDHKVFVAHNINFDLNFIKQYFQRSGLTFAPKYTIDTVDLFRMAYPCEVSYQLGTLADSLKIKMNQSHHALADARATAEIMLLAIEKMSSLPRETLISIYHLSVQLKNDINQLLFTLLERYKEPSNPTFKYDDKNRLYYCPAYSNDIELKIDGSLSEFYKKVIEVNGLIYRKEQQFLIETIYENMMNHHVKLIEAEVGSGKSLAYLIAAVYYTAEFKENVLITTATKALQHQLHQNDAALISRAIGSPLATKILKSKRNYISLEFVRFLLDDKKENHDILLLKMQLLIFLLEPLQGDMELLNITGGRKVYMELMRELYRAKQDTYLYEDIKTVSHPIIGITNHAHLLHSGSEGFPKYFDHLIIDEGHQLQEVALNHTYEKWSYQNIKFQLSQLTKDDSRLQTELNAKDNSDDNDKDALVRYQLNEEIALLESTIDQWFTKLSIVDNHINFHTIHHSYLDELTSITNHFHSIYQLLKTFNLSPIAIRQFKFIERIFNSIESALKRDAFLFYTITNQNKATLTIYLKNKKINDIFNHLMRTSFESVTLLSGTLMINESLAYIKPMLGESQNDVIAFDPMHREEKVVFFVPTDVPEYQHKMTSHYIEKVLLYISSYLAMGHEKMLILFNNYQMIRTVQEYLTDIVETVILAQTPQSNAHKLMTQFNQLDHCVLLGTQSFYEGLDYQSDDFKCVMIVSLPFIHPNDIRIRLMDDETIDTFNGYQLPYAATKLRQAAGRLIRKETDDGIIICLDKRILESSYHQVFDSALSHYHVKRGTIEDLLKIVESKGE